MMNILLVIRMQEILLTGFSFVVHIKQMSKSNFWEVELRTASAKREQGKVIWKKRRSL